LGKELRNCKKFLFFSDFGQGYLRVWPKYQPQIAQIPSTSSGRVTLIFTKEHEYFRRRLTRDSFDKLRTGSADLRRFFWRAKELTKRAIESISAWNAGKQKEFISDFRLA